MLRRVCFPTEPWLNRGEPNSRQGRAARSIANRGEEESGYHRERIDPDDAAVDSAGVALDGVAG
jgi:hypothetical protein